MIRNFFPCADVEIVKINSHLSVSIRPDLIDLYSS